MNANQELLSRITCQPEIFGGKPIIRGQRLAVEHVLGYLSSGQSIDDVLAGFDWLEREDVLACIEYARRNLAATDVIEFPA